jgi:UDP-N-acetylmuramate: L-alanyl-gamma-D-glutamyl-meso-diaminopimelate ligase
MANALAAIAAANAIGVKPADACTALSSFIPPQRRLQHLGNHNGLGVYDDFAHHPTAITATLDALRNKHPQQCLIVVLEARSNTMKLGHHLGQLGQALSAADRIIIWRRPDLTWDPAELAIPNNRTTLEVCNSVEAILELLRTTINPGDQMVLMSNGDFDGLATRLINQLSTAN